MPGEYRHIEEYEKKIILPWEEGKTLMEIGEHHGLSAQFGAVHFAQTPFLISRFLTLETHLSTIFPCFILSQKIA